MTPASGYARPAYVYGLFLALAFAAGGLRADAAWLGFGAAFLAWFALSGPALSAGGLALPLLFFSWLGAASLFSPDPSVSGPVFARWAVYGLVFFGAASSGGESRRGWLAAVFAAGAACAAALVIQRSSDAAVAGLIGGNPNYSAAFCAAAFPAALLAASGASRGREAAGMASLALLLAAGIIASGSRGALAAALISGAAGLAAARRWRLLAALGAAALLGAALLPDGGLEGLLKLHDPRAFQRPRIWLAAARAAAASPLLGWGPGRFGQVFELFKFPFFDGISSYGHGTLHAHSEVLNLAAEAGLPAAVLFLAAAGAVLLRRGSGNLPVKLCALAALLQGSADMVFYSGAVSLLFWGSLGFAWRPESDTGPASPPYRYAAAAGLLLLLALPFAARYRPGAAAFSALSYAEARAGGGPFLSRALLRAAQAREPFNPFPAEAEGRLLLSAGDTAAAGGAFRRALAMEPEFRQAALGLAVAEGASGRRDEACRLLSGLARPQGAELKTKYQKGLAFYDAASAAKLEKEKCGNRKTGGAIAPAPKAR